jgi:uncharacterized membrane protein
MKKIVFLSLVLSFVPSFAFAAAGATLTTLIKFLSDTLATGVLPLLITLAVVAFVYGIIQYFLNPDNEEKRKAGKSFMVWGIVSLFVMVSFWGIVGILQNTFLPDGSNNTIKMPKIPE